MDAGMVDHDTLHDAYARSGFVLYPTAFPGKGLGIWRGCYLKRHSLLQLKSKTSYYKGANTPRRPNVCQIIMVTSLHTEKHEMHSHISTQAMLLLLPLSLIV